LIEGGGGVTFMRGGGVNEEGRGEEAFQPKKGKWFLASPACTRGTSKEKEQQNHTVFEGKDQIFLQSFYCEAKFETEGKEFTVFLANVFSLAIFTILLQALLFQFVFEERLPLLSSFVFVGR